MWEPENQRKIVNNLTGFLNVKSFKIIIKVSNVKSFMNIDNGRKSYIRSHSTVINNCSKRKLSVWICETVRKFTKCQIMNNSMSIAWPDIIVWELSNRLASIDWPKSIVWDMFNRMRPKVFNRLRQSQSIELFHFQSISKNLCQNFKLYIILFSIVSWLCRYNGFEKQQQIDLVSID